MREPQSIEIHSNSNHHEVDIDLESNARSKAASHVSHKSDNTHTNTNSSRSLRTNSKSTRSKRSRKTRRESMVGDPFAPRAGKQLSWSNINMIVAGQGGKPDRKILDNVWGEVPKEEVTALMGPSGAGKTSLLNILAGRASSHGRLTIRADIRFNNMKIDTSKIENRKQIAFVAQEDSLMITATPRECILFSGRLRLPKSVPQETLEKLTTIMLRELGLNECADTLVGGGLVKGISGGQKKRTSVGVELVVKPPLIFLDEPTSGLDAFSAVQLVDVLKRVAKAGASVLFTIHQPSSDVFDSLDRLVLMKTGK